MPWENRATLSFAQMTDVFEEAGVCVLSMCFRSELSKIPFSGYLSWREGRCLSREPGTSLTNGQIVSLLFSLVELKLVFSSGKRLYLLKVGFMGSAIEKTLVQEHPGNIYLLDIDWKRNLIYWTDAQGQLLYSTGYSGENQEIWTEHTGTLGWLFCVFPFLFFFFY